jgi:hypothetical protein
MSLLSEIIRHDSPLVAKQLAHLINIVKHLGWESFNDPRTIKPTLRRCELYIRRNSKRLEELFGRSFEKIRSNDVVDVINPYLIKMWQIQIIGTIDAASLQLLTLNLSS